jgi:deoxycytidylate deaminase
MKITENKKNRILLKVNTFFNIVESVSNLSVSQTLKVGCVAIKKDFSKIASIGYNGTYPNAPTILETNGEELSLISGHSGFVHAEINMALKFKEPDVENYVVLLSHSPCRLCAISLINAGFKSIYWLTEYRDVSHFQIFDNCSVKYGNKFKLIERLENSENI